MTDDINNAINKSERLEALYRLKILDTENSPIFDYLTQIATYSFGVPVSLVSLVDHNRQWFKSCMGLEISETDLGVSFCKHTLILKDREILCIPDATKDERFCNNELVREGIQIRFYAGAPLLLSDGEIVGSFCIIDDQPRYDFDDRKKHILQSLADLTVYIMEAELANDKLHQANNEYAQLKEQSDLLLQAIDHSLSGITVSDMRQPDQPITYINKHFTTMTGYSYDEAVGRNCRFLQGEKTDRETVNKIKTAINNKENIEVELLNYHKNGRPFLNKLRLTPVFDSKGLLSSYIGIQDDVTVRRQQELERRHHAKLASLGEVSGAIAHEINNALQPLLGLTEIVKNKIETLDSEAYECMCLIEENAIHARKILEDTLSFARKESTELEVFPAEYVINEATNFASNVLPSSISVKKVNFDDKQLKNENLNDKYIRISKNGLIQILNNLFRNAAHAMHFKGEIEVSVEHISDLLSKSNPNIIDGEYICLHIKDQGDGIDEKIIKHIFEPFFTTKEHGQGTGLGLSVAYGLVQSWGGYLDIKSKKGKGTSVILFLPVYENNN